MDARLFLENSTVCQIVDAIWLMSRWVLVETRAGPTPWGCRFFDTAESDWLHSSSVGGVAVSFVGCFTTSVVGCHVDINGEFDSGSGRTLAACLTHASRTVMASLLV